MPSKTDEYDFDSELISFYTDKVKLLEDARVYLRNYELEKRSGDFELASTGRLESEHDFNEVMNELMFFAYPKLKKSSNIDLPDDLDSSIDDEFYTCKDLTNEQKKRLLYKIRDLFEALNITSLEREKWEADGLGAVNKKGDSQ